MPLTRKQVAALPVLDWLLDDDGGSRRSGRSFIIAISLIRKALRHPGCLVSVIDHYKSEASTVYLIQMIQFLIDKDARLKDFSWSIHENTIMVIESKSELRNWIPELPSSPPKKDKCPVLDKWSFLTTRGLNI